MTTALRIVFVMCFLLSSVSFWTQEAGYTEDEGLRKTLDEIDHRISQIEDLTAEFEQRKYSLLLRQPLVSRGSVRVVGSKMRWDTEQPAESTILMDDTTLRIHYPELKILEMYPLDRQLANLAASPLPRMSTLREHFTMERDEPRPELEPDHLALRLVPRHAELARFIHEIRVAIDQNNGYLIWMRMIDADEERTEIRFRKHRVNSGIAEDDVNLVVPAGTRIVQPIGELESQSDTDTQSGAKNGE